MMKDTQPTVRRRRLMATGLAYLIGNFASIHQVRAQTRSWESGRDYLRLDPPRPTAPGDRIELLEFFYYGCPVCYEFQPFFTRYLFQAPPYVAVRRIPAVSNESWEPFARLYYALNMLGEAGRLHWPVYDNYHFDGVKLNEPGVMIDWVTRNGVDRQKFIAAYRSEEVQRNLDHSRELMKLYNISGVPSVAIDGRYLTSARLAGGTRQLAQLVEELVRQVRQERTKR